MSDTNANLQEYLPYQQRVIEEKAELDDRIAKLDIFLGSEIYSTLPPDERYELNLQGLAMKMYSNILYSRIARFQK